jgi:hypothetical protein
MARRSRPVFLDRPRYRQSRVRDAARLLPVVGAVLLSLPLLWGGASDADAPTNSGALLYLFGAWAALIAAAFVLSRRLRPDDEDEDPPEGRGR